MVLRRGIAYFICVWCVLLAQTIVYTHAGQLSLSGCVTGSGCRKCPANSYTVAADGSMLCCPGCTSTLQHGEYPSKWCVCYSESASPGSTTARNGVDSRTKQPVPSSLESRILSSKNDAVDVLSDPLASPSEGSVSDAVYILNQGGHSAVDRFGSSSTLPVPVAVQQALTMMAEAIEALHVRLTRLENIILHSPDLQPSGSVNRLGTASPTSAPQSTGGVNQVGSTSLPTSLHPSGSLNQMGTASPPSEDSCLASNFTRIGDRCYHFSVWRGLRLHWKDASDSCETMGAKLAEPITRSEFVALTQHLSSSASVIGYSYWIGGLYPGMSWRWVYNGKEVTLDPFYWTREDSLGRKVIPGNTTTGRCLSLTFQVKASDYYYYADECGFEKYYICELLEKIHQRH